MFHQIAVALLFLALIPDSWQAENNKFSYTITCKEKKEIVDLHNELRKKLAEGMVDGQPKASNMQRLVWDDKLAELAQGWAEKKKFEHNRSRKDPRFKVGENVATAWSNVLNTSVDWSSAINGWFDEHKLYKYKPIADEPKTAHYTQMAWGQTTHVGCGFNMYKRDGFHHKLYVCNYGPSGNMLHQRPYRTGAGCEHLCCKSQCGKHYGEQC